MKTKKFKEKGITLIALVITIIVLLILVGVTLSILLQTGIIENSQRAVNLYQSKAEDEIKQIDDLAIQMQKQFGMLDNTEGKENKTITGSEESTYNNPVIPVGFKTSNEGASWKSSDGETVDGWNDGLVIEDKEGNQFVWVPAYVDQIDGKSITQEKIDEYEANKIPKYEKWCTIGKLYSDATNDTLPMLNSSDNDTIQAYEEKQIGTYGGFYIGRYEAGTTLEYDSRNQTDKPIVQQYQNPWNNINYNNAKASAESMYQGDKVQSVLITGTMWDTVMKWLELDGVNVQTQTPDNAWGNYCNVAVIGVSGYYGDSDGNDNEEKMAESNWKNATIKPSDEANILKTGESEFTKKKNIYDLAGNMWEWTNEIMTYYREGRGGSYDCNASYYPAAYRINFHVSDGYDGASFRLGLYIK